MTGNGPAATTFINPWAGRPAKNELPKLHPSMRRFFAGEFA